MERKKKESLGSKSNETELKNEVQTSTVSSGDKISILAKQYGIPSDVIQPVLSILDARIDERIAKKLEEERPKIVQGLKEAIMSLIPQPQTESQAQNPQSNPMLAMLLNALTSSGKSDMDRLADTITKARAISDALNPPSIWDKVFPQIIVRAFMKSGFLTEKEGSEVLKEVVKSE